MKSVDEDTPPWVAYTWAKLLGHVEHATGHATAPTNETSRRAIHAVLDYLSGTRRLRR
jgi:hypothetical protein